MHSEAPSEIVVVDNASPDGSADMVEQEFPGVVLHRNATNAGYGAAANQALRSCAAKYMLLLNADTQLQPGTLEALRAYLDQNPRAAVVGPRLVNVDGTLQRSCYPFPTPLNMVLDQTSAWHILRRIPGFREYLLQTHSHTRARVVPWVLGAAVAMRRRAIEAVGGFDEQFFMYSEDVDLCFRLAQAGWQVHFAPVIDLVHVGGASTEQRRADMIVRRYASLARFYRLHYSRVRQAELEVLLTAVLLAWLVRDWCLTQAQVDPQKRGMLAERVEAWRRLLRGDWRKIAAL
jgi:N-acetylglucosaminyl-diphospho-decaprenol L-rhamnosyltransferase